MARVTDPEISESGEVKCTDCPFNETLWGCFEWWGEGAEGFKCPTIGTYTIACELAEKEAQR